MKRIVFWFDAISPFAWLAFERLPQALKACSYEVEYRPILFAGLLKHWGQKGPAEIEPKRAWTFRHVHWLAAEHGIEMAEEARSFDAAEELDDDEDEVSARKLRTETFDAERHDVAFLEILRRIAAEPDACRRARADHVAWLERHALRQVAHEMLH